MSTTIEIDERVMKELKEATGLQSEQEVVDLSLRTLLQMGAQKKLLDLYGKIQWEGDLDDMRTDK